MKIFVCEREWEAILTCIYDAWASKAGQQNLMIRFEPVSQYNLFDEYVHVKTDYGKAGSVMDAINRQISPMFYLQLLKIQMAYEDDVADVIYRMVILGFKFGPEVVKMLQYYHVMRYNEIMRRLDNESHSFIEFCRFHEVRGCMYVAHIEPKSRLVLSMGNYFQDRMPSEHWMIIDDVHKEAVVHPKDEDFYFRKLTDEEYERLLETENENDEYTDLWQVFFNSIAIKERENYRCQRNFFPIWKRKHAVEFTHRV